MGYIDPATQPKLLARPRIICPSCNGEMIIYTVELPVTKKIEDRTIHHCGVPKNYERPIIIRRAL